MVFLSNYLKLFKHCAESTNHMFLKLPNLTCCACQIMTCICTHATWLQGFHYLLPETNDVFFILITVHENSFVIFFFRWFNIKFTFFLLLPRFLEKLSLHNKWKTNQSEKNVKSISAVGCLIVDSWVNWVQLHSTRWVDT